MTHIRWMLKLRLYKTFGIPVKFKHQLVKYYSMNCLHMYSASCSKDTWYVIKWCGFVVKICWTWTLITQFLNVVKYHRSSNTCTLHCRQVHKKYCWSSLGPTKNPSSKTVHVCCCAFHTEVSGELSIVLYSIKPQDSASNWQNASG